MGVGYGDEMGSYWEVAPTDTIVTTGYTLTSLPTSANGVFEYIYIDTANSSLPSVAIKNSTTAPAWSDSFMGWYDGINRCIGVVWITPAGTISPFVCPDDETYLGGAGTILSSISTSTTYPVWNAVDCTAYVPVNAYELRLELNNYWNGTGTAWTFYKMGIQSNNGGAYTSNHTGTTKFEDGAVGATIQDWFAFSRGSAKKLTYVSWGPSTAGIGSLIRMGYRIER